MSTMDMEIADAIKTGSQFAYFSKVPNEISSLILTYAVSHPAPRIIPIISRDNLTKVLSNIPTGLLHAFAFARAVARKRYSAVRFPLTHTFPKSRQVYVDWQQDTIFVENYTVFKPLISRRANWQRQIRHLAIGSDWGILNALRLRDHPAQRVFPSMRRLTCVIMECGVGENPPWQADEFKDALVKGRHSDATAGEADAELYVVDEMQASTQVKNDGSLEAKQSETVKMADKERLARMREMLEHMRELLYEMGLRNSKYA